MLTNIASCQKASKVINDNDDRESIIAFLRLIKYDKP